MGSTPLNQEDFARFISTLRLPSGALQVIAYTSKSGEFLYGQGAEDRFYEENEESLRKLKEGKPHENNGRGV